MGPFEHLPGEDLQDYRQALELMEQLDFLRHVWHLMRPAPPLTRGDLMLCGNLRSIEAAGQTPVTVSELARHMRQSVPGISQKVSALEKQGYLRRVASEKDRRVVALELTDEGRALTQNAMIEFLGKMQEALERMGEKDTGQLIHGLDALNRVILEQQEDKTGEC